MESKKKQATFGIAIIPVIFLVGLLYFVIKNGGDAHMSLFISAMFAAAIAIFGLGFKWAEIEEGIVETIKMAMGAIIILMIIGQVIGTWILSGIVPTMIFYGLKILSPGIFLVATLLICSIVSLATGSSWTTAGTVGIALMGVGIGLGLPAPVIGGCIISGSYFGDKMSPLSDTTNLAPAMAGSTLFDHVKHMIYTTTPAYIISLIVFGVLGAGYANNVIDRTNIDIMLQGLQAEFNINAILMIVPVIVIGIVVMKVPAIPGLFAGGILGGIAAMIFQGSDVMTVLTSLQYGYESTSEIPAVVDLLTRGGMDNMMWTISLILCAMIFGGVMERTGMLGAIANSILRFATSTGNLVTSVIFTCIFMNIIAGDQYLAIVIPGRMYKQAFEDRNLAPRNLSRCLEDAGTLTSPLIPWNTCGATMMGTLGLAPWTYVPYCVLNLVNPLVSIFYGYTGITMMKLDPTKPIGKSVSAA